MGFTLRHRRSHMAATTAVLAVAFAAGCGSGGSKLAITCTDFLAKSESEQLDIAKSFGSKSLYREDDPAEDAVIPGVQNYRNTLASYCSESDNGDDNLNDLNVEVGS